jgi:hypothetical protein
LCNRNGNNQGHKSFGLRSDHRRRTQHSSQAPISFGNQEPEKNAHLIGKVGTQEISFLRHTCFAFLPDSFVVFWFPDIHSPSSGKKVDMGRNPERGRFPILFAFIRVHSRLIEVFRYLMPFSGFVTAKQTANRR